jgi:iron complex outermembrane receptor protein
MNSIVRYALAASCALLTALARASAATEQVSGSKPELEEIVVTAQRRLERLQDVPISIAAIDSSAIERSAVRSFDDYATMVPGISVNFGEGPSGARGRRTVGIRGVQRFSGLTDSTIGFYVDETPIDLGANPTIIDVDRIEVLRGPQGTLYGSGSMGGTIRIITRSPDPSAFSGQVDATYSETDHGDGNYDLNGIVNIPLSPNRAALRIAATTLEDSGFVDIRDRLTGEVLKRGADDQSTQAVRAGLLFNATDRLSFTPSVFYQRYEIDSAPQFVVGGDDYTFYKNEYVPTSTKVDSMVASLAIGYHFDFGDLESTIARVEYQSRSFEDITETVNAALFGLPNFLPAPVDSTTQRNSWSNETRLVSNLSGPFQYVAGIYFEAVEAPFTSTSVIPGLNDAISPPLPVLLPSVPGGDELFSVVSTRDSRQFAVFGEATYFLSKRFELTGGLRWFNFDSESTDTFSGFQFGGTPASNPAVERKGSGSSDGFTPKLVLSYHATADQLFYGLVAKGYRSGGSNIPLPSLCDGNLIASGITPPAPSEFKPDSLWNYELGAKVTGLDRRLTANAAAYYLDWTDLQLAVPLPTCRIQGYIANAGKARSIGAEFELTMRPVEDFTFGLSAAYLDSELTQDSQVLHAPRGTALLNMPKWTASGYAEYERAFASDMSAYLRIDAQYRGEAHVDYTGDLMSDSYTEAGTRLGIRSGRWEAALFVENLTNESPYLSNDPRSGAPGYYAYSLRPRTVGLTIRATF